VKIRVGSLFRTSFAPVRASEAALRERRNDFPQSSTECAQRAQDVHRWSGIPACAESGFQCKVERERNLVASDVWVRRGTAARCPRSKCVRVR